MSNRLLLVSVLSMIIGVAYSNIPRVSINVISVDGIEKIRLSWEPIEGAESYNIYSTNDPFLEYWGEPIITLSAEETEYSLEEIRSQEYFQVTAIIPPPDWLVLVEGDLFGEHQVTIDPFYISKYEVTQAEFTDLMGEHDFWFEGDQRRPAESVSWFDAVEFCNRLSIRDGLTPVYGYNGRVEPDRWYIDFPGWNEEDTNHSNITCDWDADGYRLPTDAEWNHAANAGIHPPPYIYSGSNNIGDVAWYSGNAGHSIGMGHPDFGTHPVGTKAPNGLGIHDMSGNVSEWCWDIWGGAWPPEEDNPRGPETGSIRVLRGGCWSYPESSCTVSIRNTRVNATYSDYLLGFRICRIIP